MFALRHPRGCAPLNSPPPRNLLSLWCRYQGIARSLQALGAIAGQSLFAGQSHDAFVILNCFSLWCRFIKALHCFATGSPSRPTRRAEIINNLILNYINVIFPCFSNAAKAVLHSWPFAIKFERRRPSCPSKPGLTLKLA